MIDQQENFSSFLTAKTLGLKVEDLEYFVEKKLLTPLHNGKSAVFFSSKEVLNLKRSPEFDIYLLELSVEHSNVNGMGGNSYDDFELPHLEDIDFSQFYDEDIKNILGMDKNETDQNLTQFTSTLLWEKKNYIQVEPHDLPYYHKTPLYQRLGQGEYLLFKPSGMWLMEKMEEDSSLSEFYIKIDDFYESAIEIQQGIQKNILNFLDSKDKKQLRRNFESLFSTIMLHPETKLLGSLVNILAEIIYTLAHEPVIDIINCKDFVLGNSMQIHATNMLLLALRFCKINKYSSQICVDVALSAFFHDVGKIKLPENQRNIDNLILQMPLTNKLKAHPVLGYKLIKSAHIENENLLRGILEHHERLDKSGYPRVTDKISFYGQLLSILDTFFKYTYVLSHKSESTQLFNVLQMLKKDVTLGKFNGDLFKELIFSFKSD